MKKILIIFAVLAGVLLTVSGYRDRGEMDVELYFVDSSMQRLIPSDFSLDTKNPELAAKAIIRELLRGRDSNDKIMRVIPCVEDGLSVKLEGKTAVVNMTDEFVKNHSDLRQHETLTIYQIVNSLTSVDGIVNVRFTIDKKIQKDFKGFCDMRETFIPDYYI